MLFRSRGALISAAKKSGFRVPNSRKGWADAIKASCHFLEDGSFTNVTKDKLEREIQYVTIQRVKVERVWPKVPDNWEAVFSIVIDEPVNLEVLKALLDYCGKFVGIGDYRPSYGRFEIKNIKEVQNVF